MTPQRSTVPAQFQSEPLAATARQVTFLQSLMEQKELTASPGFVDATQSMDAEEVEQYVTRLVASFTRLSRRKASETIETLLALPNKVQEPRKTDPKPYKTELQSGRYAVEHDGTLKFYKLDRPTSGRWTGYTFLKVQASDDLHRIRGKMAEEVIALIEADPIAAMKRYGQELGHCGRCGRTLTDETSRELGIGPVCRGEVGI